MSNPGNRFVSCRVCVRACARSGCLVELDRKRGCLPFPFSLFGARSFPFSLFGATSFPFSLPAPPKTSYPIVVGLIGMERLQTYWSMCLHIVFPCICLDCRYVAGLASGFSANLSQGFAPAAGAFDSCRLPGCWRVGLLIDLMVCWLVAFLLFGGCFVSFFY